LQAVAQRAKADPKVARRCGAVVSGRLKRSINHQQLHPIQIPHQGLLPSSTGRWALRANRRRASTDRGCDGPWHNRRGRASIWIGHAQISHFNGPTLGKQQRALKAIFSPAGVRPAISSTKALTGHGLSLAGAMESGFCALALRDGFMPGSAHITQLDPECEGLNILRSTLAARPRIALNNVSGFGGANVSTVFKQAR
jgi:hypothetical protein